MFNKFISTFILLFLITNVLSGCARDLSTNTYTSDSTLNITLQGKLLAKRDIKITEEEKLSDNTIGGIGGAVAGGVIAAHNNSSTAMVVGGAIVGGLTGAILQSMLGTSQGTEYIVQVDRSNLQNNYYEGSRLLRNAMAAVRATGIITIVQAKEGGKNNQVINVGQNVLIILSEKRTRLIPSPY
jgi:outer membrane lipoprotein SlyB